MSDLVDRKYVSRYSQPGFGIKVYRAGVIGDADAPPTVSLLSDESTEPEWTATSTRTDVGSYGVLLPSTVTATPRHASLRWDYAIASQPQVFALDLEVGPSAPDYDILDLAWQGIIERAWYKFADLFDSPFGGPNLAVYAQTKFGRNRLAQLLPEALQTLNSHSQPHKTYPFGGTDFPFAEWGPLLSQALYIEIIKHLIRSYIEQPEVVLGTAVSRLDRRDYMQRWSEMLNLEQADFQRDLKRYRMAHMGLGNFSVMVSGGAYGRIGYSEPPGGLGAAAARGYFYFSRWH